MLSRSNQIRGLTRPFRVRLARCYALPTRTTRDVTVEPGRRRAEKEDYELAKELTEEYARQGIDVRGAVWLSDAFVGSLILCSAETILQVTESVGSNFMAEDRRSGCSREISWSFIAARSARREQEGQGEGYRFDGQWYAPYTTVCRHGGRG